MCVDWIIGNGVVVVIEHYKQGHRQNPTHDVHRVNFR